MNQLAAGAWPGRARKQRFYALRGYRSDVVEALCVLTMMLFQKFDMLRTFDAFRYQLELQAVVHSDDRLYQGVIVRFRVVSDEGLVYLEFVDR